MLKSHGIIKVNNDTNEIVGAWLSQKSLDAIGAKVGDFLYLNIGWSGTRSGRAHIKLVTEDVRVSCNFNENDRATIWRHGNWM